MLLPLLMTAHVAGALLWIGGLCAAASVMILHASEGSNAPQALSRLERSFLFKACHPGMLLAIVSGAGLVAWNSGYFLQEGWLYAKLLLVLGLIVLTMMLTAARRRLSASPSAVSVKSLSLQLWFAAATALLIFILVFLKPF